jgi:hypothetical protein
MFEALYPGFDVSHQFQSSGAWSHQFSPSNTIETGTPEVTLAFRMASSDASKVGSGDSNKLKMISLPTNSDPSFELATPIPSVTFSRNAEERVAGSFWLNADPGGLANRMYRGCGAAGGAASLAVEVMFVSTAAAVKPLLVPAALPALNAGTVRWSASKATA